MSPNPHPTFHITQCCFTSCFGLGALSFSDAGKSLSYGSIFCEAPDVFGMAMGWVLEIFSSECFWAPFFDGGKSFGTWPNLWRSSGCVWSGDGIALAHFLVPIIALITLCPTFCHLFFLPDPHFTLQMLLLIIFCAPFLF